MLSTFYQNKKRTQISRHGEYSLFLVQFRIGIRHIPRTKLSISNFERKSSSIDCVTFAIFKLHKLNPVKSGFIRWSAGSRKAKSREKLWYAPIPLIIALTIVVYAICELLCGSQWDERDIPNLLLSLGVTSRRLWNNEHVISSPPLVGHMSARPKSRYLERRDNQCDFAFLPCLPNCCLNLDR